jgi:hypothetical protein
MTQTLETYSIHQGAASCGFISVGIKDDDQSALFDVGTNLGGPCCSLEANDSCD